MTIYGDVPDGESGRGSRQPLVFMKYSADGTLEVTPPFVNRKSYYFHQFQRNGVVWRYEIENMRELSGKLADAFEAES